MSKFCDWFSETNVTSVYDSFVRSMISIVLLIKPITKSVHIGVYFGVCMYISRTFLPGLLTIKDITQSVVSFQHFWPRSREMPVSCLVAGLCGIMVYLLDEEIGSTQHLPWLGTALVILSMVVYQRLIIYPHSVKSLMETNHPARKEKEVVSLFKKFTKLHHLQTVVGGTCFLSFTYFLYCT